MMSISTVYVSTMYIGKSDVCHLYNASVYVHNVYIVCNREFTYVIIQ